MVSAAAADEAMDDRGIVGDDDDVNDCCGDDMAKGNEWVVRGSRDGEVKSWYLRLMLLKLG